MADLLFGLTGLLFCVGGVFIRRARKKDSWYVYTVIGLMFTTIGNLP